MARLQALPFVRAGVSEGLSANQSYREYVDLAHQQDLTGMRRQDYLRLYSQTRALRGQAADALKAPKDVPGGGLRPQQRDTVTARGYGHWVVGYQRTRGTSDFMHTPYLVKSQQILTPEQAEAEARGWFEKNPDEYNRVLIGITFVGIEQFNPMPR